MKRFPYSFFYSCVLFHWMNVPVFTYQSPFVKGDMQIVSNHLLCPLRKETVIWPWAVTMRHAEEWVQSDTNLENPFACFFFKQLDRPLESAQLFFLPWIKTIWLGEVISISPFLKSQYNATVKHLKPDYPGFKSWVFPLKLFKFSLSQSRGDDSIFLTRFYEA